MDSPHSVSRRGALGLLLLSVLLGGCIAPMQRPSQPMPVLPLSQATQPADSVAEAAEATATNAPRPHSDDRLQHHAPCAVVFLPGSFSYPKAFARHGFDTVLRQRHPEIHMVAANAHMGYYRQRSILVRLAEDVVGPLRRDGYRVWLAGISLGGLGSLLYAKEHGDAPDLGIEGLVVMAPFLGDPPLIEEIQAAGGPLQWQPSADAPRQLEGRKSVGHVLWPWLADWHEARTAGRAGPEIVLAYGLKDGFAPAGEQLAELLPEEDVFTHPAGHDWAAWRPLWQDIVQAGTFDGCAGLPQD